METKMESVDDYEYNASDFIGHGAFAVVFKGRNKKEPGHVVAIKKIQKKNLSKSQTFPEKEIEILKELHHENVVALMHFKETPSSLFMVMEFCNGGDLADYLHVKGTLSEGTICLFLRQIAAAMKTLHAKGIIHRDLKPQNLLLSYKGRVRPPPPPSEIVIKIADFGFARFLEEDMMAATICGSPLYMAPEVITSQQYTAKADLWSVGTIIYQCLTGTAPFKASNPKELKMFYEKAKIVEPKIFPGTSEHMRDLLLRLLKRAQKDRIEFDDFFNHPFLRTKVQSTSSTSPLPVPTRASSCSSDSPEAPMSISPVTSVPISSPEDPIVIDPQRCPSSEDSPSRSPLLKTIIETSGMCETVEDDFVLVSRTSISRGQQTTSNAAIQVRASARGPPSVAQSGATASPPFPSTFSTPFTTGNQSQESTPSPSGRPSTLAVGSSQAPAASPKTAKRSPKAGPSSALVLHRTSPQATQMRTKASSPTHGTALSPVNYSSSLPTGGILHRICQNQSPSPSPPQLGRKSSPSSGEGESPKPWVLKMSPPQPPRKHTDSTPPRLIKSPARRKKVFETEQVSSPARLGTHHFTSPPSLPAIQSRKVSSPTEPISLPFINASRRARTSSDLTDVSDYSPRDSALFRRSVSFGRLADQNALRAAFDSLPRTPSTSLEGIPGACLATTPPAFPTFFIGTSSRRNSQYGEGSPSSQGSITFAASPPNMEGPIMFEPPELVEETIMKPEHNETVDRLNIMYGIVMAIIDLAQSRNDPLAQSVYHKDITSVGATSHICFVSENQRRAEQMVLYARAMELLTAALHLAKEELTMCNLMNSKAVRNVITQLHLQYKSCFHQCMVLGRQNTELKENLDRGSAEITADRLMYSHALDLCQSTGFEEMCGNPEECISRYRSAQMLLHGLCLQATGDRDREHLLKLKNFLDQRLLFLEKQLHHSTSLLPFTT